MSNWNGKGQGSKGEMTLKHDTGGIIFEPSNWTPKTSKRAVVGNMPLMSEFPCYLGWETSAKRWGNLLYNHPVSNVIEYFIGNLRDSRNPLDRGSGIGGFLKRNSRKKMGLNEELVTKGEVFEKYGYEWMFRALEGKYEERPGGSHQKE